MVFGLGFSLGLDQEWTSTWKIKWNTRGKLYDRYVLWRIKRKRTWKMKWKLGAYGDVQDLGCIGFRIWGFLGSVPRPSRGL